MLSMRIVGVMKVIEDGDRLNDSVDELVAERGDASRYDG
jgi:hypothetical protein